MQYTLLQGAPVIIGGWERDAANDQATRSTQVNKLIEQMALDAGLEDIFQDGSHWQSGGARSVAGDRLEAFAQAVAKRCAEICAEMADEYSQLENVSQLIGTAGTCALRIEREFGIDGARQAEG